MATTKNKAADIKPLRIKVREAAALMSLDKNYVYQLVHDGVFTPIRPNGKGPGKKLYLLPAEVEAFAVGGRAAVEKLRAKQAR